MTRFAHEIISADEIHDSLLEEFFAEGGEIGSSREEPGAVEGENESLHEVLEHLRSFPNENMNTNPDGSLAVPLDDRRVGHGNGHGDGDGDVDVEIDDNGLTLDDLEFLIEAISGSEFSISDEEVETEADTEIETAITSNNTNTNVNARRRESRNSRIVSPETSDYFSADEGSRSEDE